MDWRCRVYVDGSAPASVIQRLEAAGGEVVLVGAAMLGWPRPMWRFSALNDVNVRPVIFWDADSIISAHEAGAVTERIAEGQDFHAMRDSGSHTELLLAGLWDARAGALPSVHSLVGTFLKHPGVDAHFADPLFLRHYVWP